MTIYDFAKRRPFTPDELRRAERALERWQRHTIDVDVRYVQSTLRKSRIGAAFAWGVLVGSLIGMGIDALAVTWHWFGRGL